MSRALAALRAWTFFAGLVLAHASLAEGDEVGTAFEGDEDHALAQELSVCAAYYFNATNVAPMSAYEEVYSAGEQAFNGAVSLIGRAAVDKAIAEASASMTALMAQNWQYFHRVDARYKAPCAELLEGMEPLEDAHDPDE